MLTFEKTHNLAIAIFDSFLSFFYICITTLEFNFTIFTNFNFAIFTNFDFEDLLRARMCKKLSCINAIEDDYILLVQTR
jgi:hypothetical protein